MSTRYDYRTSRALADASDVRTAIRFSVFNYMQDQLGWNSEDCERRVEEEIQRHLPRVTLDGLQLRGWRLSGARVLDVGAGQGGLLLELLMRGAEAYGVEPGPEFAAVARMRLAEADLPTDRLLEESGESLPFDDQTFDYAISLRVLEHVRDPGAILREMFRVLKPGGECVVRCENYLSFREQHYRLPWLPLLPKSVGSAYLRLLGRNPEFLQRYVVYTTYPQIWRLCHEVGFENLTYEPQLTRIASGGTSGFPRQALTRLMAVVPDRFRRRTLVGLLHLIHVCRVGVRLHLRKPAE